MHASRARAMLAVARTAHVCEGALRVALARNAPRVCDL
jgi:hypothetical protein